MRSPFSIFRKYQKIAMVIILLLIMVTFTIGDAVMQMSGNLPVVLIVVMTAMIGASVGALIGVQAGKPSEYAIAGVAIGVIVSLVASNLGGPAAAVETSAGNLSHKQLDELVQRRLTANAFVTSVFQRVSPPPQEANPFFREIWQNQLAQFQFSNGLAGFSNDSEESRARLQSDVVLGYLLNREADQMGIEVSDDTVNTYIQSIKFGFGNSERHLTLDDFRDIRTNMHISESNLYDALRAELRVRMALRNLSPDFLPTPEDFWKIHRQLNVRQRLDVAAIPVEALAKDLSEPDAEKIAVYFDEFKGVLPGTYGPGSPGFVQPRKVALAYLEAPFDEFKKQVGDVSDAEVEKYYQDNKEVYRNNPFPADNKLDADREKDIPLDAEFFPGNDGPALTPKTSPPADAPKDAAAPDATSKESPKADDQKSAPQEAPKAEPAPENKPDEKNEDNKDEKGARSERPSTLGTGELLALYQPPGKSEPVETPAAKTAPAPDAAKKTEETPAAAKEAPAKADEAVAAPANSDDADRPVVAPKPGDQAAPEPEYRPLDDKLRTSIREMIVRTRTIERMKAAIDAAVDDMQKLRSKYIEVDDKGNPGISEAEIAERAKQIAQERNLKYSETQLLSLIELSDADANPIGSTADPLDMQIDPSSVRTIWQKAHASHSRQLFDPWVSEATLTSDRYAVWKTQDKEQHVPTLDEPGVKEQVVAALKRKDAEPLAEKRADELAKLVTTKKESMSKALAGQTVTGKPDGPALATQLTESFSWLRESSAPQTNMFQRSPPEVTDVSALKNVDEHFMEVIFDQMSDGDVKAMPNADKSIYYVVQVYERKPSTPEDENAMRQALLRGSLFGGFMGGTPYSYRLGMSQGRVRNQWVNELMQKYSVTWGDLSGETVSR